MKKAALAVLAAGMILSADAQTVKKKVKPGNSLYEIVYNGENNAVYVATTRGNTGIPAIYQLSAADLTVQDSILVGDAAAFGLGINEKTQTLYTSNTRGNSVHAIDLKTNKVIATIQSGQEKSHTRQVVVDEMDNKVYVSDVGGGIWVIDGKTNAFSHRIENAGLSITGMALDKKKDRLYAVDNKANKVISYDLKTKSVIDSFATGSERAINLALDTKANRLFVANQGSGDVAVLDAESGKLLKTIPTGEGALGITYCPEKNLVYVANRGAGTVTIIDAADYNIVAEVKSGSLPNTVAVDKKGNAYVTNRAQGTGRPKPGETPKPSNDPEGDIVTLIGF